eukprot:1156785-Pelagomonas_calceolata.AAC.19
MGLLARKTVSKNRYQSKTIKDSFSRTLPPHIHNAVKNGHYPRENGLSLGLRHSMPALQEL